MGQGWGPYIRRMPLRTETDLREFYNQHYRDAVRQALRILNDLQEAEDVVQECIVKLWEKRTTLKDNTSILPFFKTMVRNRSIDALRRRIPIDDNAEADEAEVTMPDTLEFDELSKAIHAIIDNLPEKCRQVFVLSRFESMSYKEISTHLNISPKTVENQISKALKSLRQNLPDHLSIIFF